MGFPLIGVLGAGPETRLAYAAANRLGLRYRVLARSGRDSAARVVPDAVSGDLGDLQTLQAFAEHCAAVLVAEPEVPMRHLQALAERGLPVVPSPAVLALLDDPDVLKERLEEAGIAVTGEFPDPAAALSVLVARSPSGQAVVYPLAQTRGVGSTAAETVVPAPALGDDVAVGAQELALKVAAVLQQVGVVAVWLTAGSEGVRVAAVEPLATTNCGWTLDGAVTDAFEQHLRAALDLPLGDPSLVAPTVVSADVVGRPDFPQFYPAYKHLLARDPGLRVHMYGVEAGDGEHVGHVTVLGYSADELLERARHAAGYLRGDIRE